MVDQPQQQECQDDRETTHEQRQRGGDESAKHPEGEQQQDREGEHLGALKIGRGRFVDLVERHVVAAEAHAAAGELGAHPFHGMGGVFAVGEGGEHEREAAVTRDELRQVRIRSCPPTGPRTGTGPPNGPPVVDRALEARLGCQQCGHVCALALRGGVCAHVSPAGH